MYQIAARENNRTHVRKELMDNRKGRAKRGRGGEGVVHDDQCGAEEGTERSMDVMITLAK